MTICEKTDVPSFETIDVAAVRAKYAYERDRRITEAGQAQYSRPSGEVVESYVKDPHKEIAPRDPIVSDIDVIVLGAGWGGTLASYHLSKLGVTDFRNIDTAGDFGGVWYWNRYPGIQCDNDAYCYLPLLEETGFMPSKKFSDGWEIQGYTRKIAELNGFADKALFHTHISGLKWDDGLQRWHVTTNRGDHFKARFVVMACGVLNMPKLPSIKGIDKFKGRMFHTARWDYDYTGGEYGNPVMNKLKDKTVAILGTGATAIQAVPYLAKYAKQLYVIQRTPSTIDERDNPPTDLEWVKSLQPGWQAHRKENFHRAAMSGFNPNEIDLICDIWTEVSRNVLAEMREEGLPELSLEENARRREAMDYRVMERMRQRVADIVADPETAESLKPYYRFMCKRPLSNSEFYPVFNQPNVKLIDVSHSKGLEELTEHGFIANGQEYDVDCMIFASGFEVTSDLERRWGIDFIEGKDGESIYDHWREGPKTLHGMMTNNFPNQFFIGYIQGAANSSVTEQFGEQGRHIAHVIADTMKRGATSVEVTKEGQEEYVRLFEELEYDTSVFLGECTPGYFNNEGEKKPRWALFRSWGRGWDDFQEMTREWREKGDMAGMKLTMPDHETVPAE